MWIVFLDLDKVSDHNAGFGYTCRSGSVRVNFFILSFFAVLQVRMIFDADLDLDPAFKSNADSYPDKQCCGSETIYLRSGSYLPGNYGSGSYLSGHYQVQI